MTDALSYEELLRPWLTAELVLLPGMQIQAGWRTGGIPVTLKPDTEDRLPVLVAISGLRRLVIGFEPFTELRTEHAALAGQLAAAARSLALEVGLLARDQTAVLGSASQPGEVSRLWVTNVHLRPGQTRLRMDPYDGDVPWLDIVGDEALCGISLGVESVTELGREHVEVASEFATALEQFAHDVRAVVVAP